MLLTLDAVLPREAGSFTGTGKSIFPESHPRSKDKLSSFIAVPFRAYRRLGVPATLERHKKAMSSSMFTYLDGEKCRMNDSVAGRVMFFNIMYKKYSRWK